MHSINPGLMTSSFPPRSITLALVHLKTQTFDRLDLVMEPRQLEVIVLQIVDYFKML